MSKSYPAREAAHMLGLAPDTIKRYCLSGKVRGEKVPIHKMTTYDGTVRRFPHGLEMWMVSEEEIKRLEK